MNVESVDVSSAHVIQKILEICDSEDIMESESDFFLWVARGESNGKHLNHDMTRLFASPEHSGILIFAIETKLKFVFAFHVECVNAIAAYSRIGFDDGVSRIDCDDSGT